MSVYTDHASPGFFQTGSRAYGIKSDLSSDPNLAQQQKAFPFAPTPEQEAAMNTFAEFMTYGDGRSVMILRGSAGTGKTVLASAIVRAIAALKQKVVLMAPTGRAAKVFALNSGHEAFTIHRKIYRQKTMTADLGEFALNDNLYHDTLFMVDEASMIANSGATPSGFGSGRLLDDLLRFVYSGRNCRLLLIGDRAQLPPIGEDDSPALSRTRLAAYGLQTFVCELSEVLRQSLQSGILFNATRIRQMLVAEQATELPKVRFAGFADIVMVPGNELIEALETSYHQVGHDGTIVIARSNKRANIFNLGIRNTILGHEEELCSGDLLMIVKNNYYWTSLSPNLGGLGYIANGDRAIVRRVRRVEQLYGFRFAEVTMTFPDYDDYELTATVLLDTLTSEAPALTHQQQTQLYNQVMEDYADIPLKPDRLKKLREDRHYNALQIKFGYAATCHKAQGGQWAHVYVDQGYMTDDMLSVDYIHWLYTAFTRATEQLYLVNWPTK